jgi:hypothetical protein
MSIRTRFAALAFGAVATLAMASLGGSEAKAQQSPSQSNCGSHCVQPRPSGGQPRVAPKYCRWAATGVHGGGTPSLQRVCVY